MGEALLIALAGVSGIAVSAWALVRHHMRQDELGRIWAVAAERLGGGLEQTGTGLLAPRRLRIRATVDGARLVLEEVAAGRGRGAASAATRATGPAPGSGGLGLEVRREGLLSGVGRTLGFDDLAVGDEAFDARFEVSAENADLALAWLDEPARAAIASIEGYSFVVGAGEVRAERAGAEGSTKGLEALARAVVVVGSSGRRLLGRWRELAAELGGRLWTSLDAFEPTGESAMTFDRGRVRVRLEVTRAERPRRGAGGRGLGTRVSARCATAGRWAGWELRADDESSPRGLLDDAQWQRLLALEPETYGADEREVSVALPGLVLDPRRLGAAVDLVAELAAGPETGPYR